MMFLVNIRPLGDKGGVALCLVQSSNTIEKCFEVYIGSEFNYMHYSTLMRVSGGISVNQHI